MYRNEQKHLSQLVSLTSLMILLMILMANCQKNSPAPSTLFELLPPELTGIDFINHLEEKPGNNILESEFFFNGGGVAVGDINNNGLPDIYFTANQGRNALYLNEGNYQFRDITDVAGLADAVGWSAGTAMVDINGNGLLDIYVCKAGNLDKEERRNKLFINNGDLTFTERAAEFGVDDPGYCTQPVFFDYNRNGLLDLFIVNYNTRTFTGFDIRTIRDEYDPYAGDKLYRNNGDGTFTDVSKEAGIMQNPIGFGLSATVSDLNQNGWPDIYVANDFMERDYLYINQGDGTFRDEVLTRTDVTSYFSMGSDIADINNDGWPDIFVADMLPPDYSRQRVFKTPNYDIYDQLVAHGYHRKNMRNVLQINNGDGTFTEVGQLAGIAKTDWSWATLIADFDNSGDKDLYVTNGFPRFYTHLDYLNDILWEKFPDEDLPDDPELLYQLVQQMEPVEMHNFAFRNLGSLEFEEITDEWGLKKYTVSGGAAYADLNGNGSLDLIVNNLNEPPSIFRNHARERNGNNYLKVKLQGEGFNTNGVGSRVTVSGANGRQFFQEAYQTRGFQSTVEPILHFGLGDLEEIDLKVIWPDQTTQILEGLTVNQTITVSQSGANREEYTESEEGRSPVFEFLDTSVLGLDFQHQRSHFNDRMANPLMPHTLSNLGPALAVADVNNDGLPDLFIGGGQGQPARLYLQQTDGTFREAEVPVFNDHNDYDDADAVFFDANGNGHLDLYVVSGGNFDTMNGPAYQDRLYLNNGFGSFTHSSDGLPEMHSSGGTVTLLDINGNGQTDLFIGGRVLTGQYPVSPRSYLLKNNEGSFTDVTEELAPDLMRAGMVTDAVWADFDNDGAYELAIAGEWMPIRIFKQNSDRVYEEITEQAGLQKSSGWWNVLKAADLNGDGNLDLVAGNRGLNSLIRAKPDESIILYNGDFNNNGMLDPLITQVIDGQRYPLPGRDQLLRQLPNLRSQFPTYESYSTATINEIIPEDVLNDSEKYYVHTFASSVFKNKGDGRFEIEPLPRYAQVAPVYDMIVDDILSNDLYDILIAGNNFGTRPEMGPIAGQGALLAGDGEYGFTALRSNETGFYGDGSIRKLAILPSQLGILLLTARNGESVLAYRYIYSP